MSFRCSGFINKRKHRSSGGASSLVRSLVLPPLPRQAVQSAGKGRGIQGFEGVERSRKGVSLLPHSGVVLGERLTHPMASGAPCSGELGLTCRTHLLLQ